VVLGALVSAFYHRPLGSLDSTSPNALASLACKDATGTALGQKALTSLAVATADILASLG